MSERSDARLIADADTDPAAFRALYDRYAASVFAVARKRTGDRESALDITAETFAQAWQSRGRFADSCGGSAGPWLFGILRHVLARAAHARQGQLDAVHALALDRRSAEVSVVSDWLDGLDEEVDSALAALPASQRRAVELRVVHDQDYGVVARELGCSPGAARIKVSRGLGVLRAELNPTHPQEQTP